MSKSKESKGDIARAMANAPDATPEVQGTDQASSTPDTDQHVPAVSIEDLPMPRFHVDQKCKSFDKNADGSIPSRLAHATLDLGAIKIGASIYASDKEVTEAGGKFLNRTITFSLPRGVSFAGDTSAYAARVIAAYDEWSTANPYEPAAATESKRPTLVKRIAVPAGR